MEAVVDNFIFCLALYSGFAASAVAWYAYASDQGVWKTAKELCIPLLIGILSIAFTSVIVEIT